MKILNKISVLLSVVVLLIPMLGSAQSTEARVSALATNWVLDVATAQVDPSDRSKYLPSTKYEAQLKISLTTFEGVDSISVIMSKTDGSGDYFSLTLPLNGDTNTSDISLEKETGANDITIHAGKYSDLSDYEVSSQLVYSNGNLG